MWTFNLGLLLRVVCGWGFPHSLSFAFRCLNCSLRFRFQFPVDYLLTVSTLLTLCLLLSEERHESITFSLQWLRGRGISVGFCLGFNRFVFFGLLDVLGTLTQFEFDYISNLLEGFCNLFDCCSFIFTITSWFENIILKPRKRIRKFRVPRLNRLSYSGLYEMGGSKLTGSCIMYPSSSLELLLAWYS